MTAATKSGDIIRCKNSHPMGHAIRDVELGETGTWGDAFRWGGDADSLTGGETIPNGGQWPKWPQCGLLPDLDPMRFASWDRA